MSLSLRRFVAALVAVLLTAAAAVIPASAASAETRTVTDAVLRWGISNEASNSAFNGSVNLMSAGIVPKTSAGDVITESEWLAESGDVRIVKNLTGGRATATWAGLRTGPDGTSSISPPTSSVYSAHEVELSNGAGTVDPATGDAALSWEGSFTVAFYGGLTQFHATDPVLTITGGTGTLTATLGGWAASQSDPDLFEPIAPRSVTLATFSGVTVGADGIHIQPNYAGVSITAPANAAAQVMSGSHPGSFPQEFVDFQGLVGQASYFYSSGGSVDASKPALPISIDFTSTEPAPEPIVVDGAQLEWSYSQYAQYGVFGPWSQTATGLNVSIAELDGEDVTGLAAEAGRTYWAARFEGGTGTIDPATGAGTITWSTGQWKLNAYPTLGIAPDETLSNPVLTIATDGTGTLTFDAYLPGHEDVMAGGGWVEPVGPTRTTVATFSSVSLADGVLTAVPEFAGREYTPPTGFSAWSECEGAGGSWPSEWVNFVPDSVKAHYYTTSCTGLNLRKPPTPVVVRLDSAPLELTTQPSISTPVSAGQDLGMKVIAAGAPIAYQWQRSTDDGDTWADVSGQTDYRYRAAAVPSDDGAMFRVVVTGADGAVTSDVVGPAEVTTDAVALVQGPSDVTVSVGELANFVAVATGAPIPGITWERSDNGGETWTSLGAGVETVNAEANQVQSSLRFEEAPITADGVLVRAVASNGYGPDITSEPATLTVESDVRAIDSATFEWGINGASQGASFSGACSYFVAGIADGTESSYATQDGDLHLLKRGVDGTAIEIDAANRCLPITGTDGRQRALFTAGEGTVDPTTGEASIQWHGAFTIYSYGGLVPWYVKDPLLTVAADGTGHITAQVGGFSSSMADPTIKEPLDPEQVTLLDLTNVVINGDDVSATSVYSGVDYFPLTDPMNPLSERSTSSAIADAVKLANPQWGSWPTSLVDFHYRTGLASYWHTSGGSADPLKPPTEPALSLNGAVPAFEQLETVSITQQPTGGLFTAGEAFTLTTASSSEGSRSLTVQWQKANGAAWVDIADATDFELTIGSPEESDSGNYRAVVSNGLQSVETAVAVVTVRTLAAPVITSQPTDAARFVGGTLRMTAIASGHPAPTYVWQRSSDGETWVTVSEASTDPTLVINGVTAADSGAQFRSIAGNSQGSVTSGSATVTVLTPEGPTVALDPSAHPVGTVFDPSTNNVISVLAGGMPVPSVRGAFGIIETSKWDARATSLALTDFVMYRSVSASLLSTGTTAPVALTVAAGLLDPSKSYLVVAVNWDPAQRNLDAAVPLLLAGQSDATVATDPGDVLAPTVPTTGDPVAHFEVTVSGIPAPTVQWEKSTDGSAWEPIPGASGTVLDYTYAPTESGLQVRAVADNGLAVDVSEAATLTLAEPIVITTQPESGVFAADEGAEFMVEVSGEVASIRWEERAADSTQWVPVDEPSSTLTLEPGETRDGWAYRVVIAGVVGATPGATPITLTSDIVTVAVTVPEEPAALLTESDITSDTENAIDLVIEGSRLLVGAGSEYAGRPLGAWVHSDPEWLGWNLADTAGATEFTLPELPAGEHRVIVVDAEGTVVGWASITVTVAEDGTITAALPNTGGGLAPVLPVALALLLAGAAVIVWRRREGRVTV